MSNINHGRRKWLSLGGIVLGAALLPDTVLAAVSTPRPRMLSFRNINTGEKLSAEFALGRGFSANTLRLLDHFLRDKRTNQVHKMDPQLFTKFYRVQQQLGLRNTEIQIICGYRSAASNAAMHRRIRGQAIDFRIDGVPLAKLRDAVQSLQDGGVGYYPRSNFVHMDTGPVRTWNGS